MSGAPSERRAPRYTGVRTFAGLPQGDAADAAVVGIPFDTATSYRPGARFGPQAIRTASALLRPWHPVHHIDVFAAQSVVDFGDVDTTPGNATRTADQIAAALTPLARAGTVTLGLGGDHSVTLGELRALASVSGPLALVLLDAHADTWDDYYGERLFHGTVFRRAAEEGVIDPTRSLLAGMRGPLYSPGDLDDVRALGFEMLSGDQLTTLRLADLAQRLVGGGRAFLSFDIDLIDPGFAPGTGTPEIAGVSPREALALIRSLEGIDFAGYDVVEVAPPYDGPGEPTALLAAGIAFELLALAALRAGGSGTGGRAAPPPA